MKENHLEEFKNMRGRINISRRGFLGGVGTLAAGAAGSALLFGCSPSSAQDTSEAEASPADATGLGAASTGNAGKTMGEVLGAGWLGDEPEIDAIADTVVADIVVCGAGHAGTATARRAAELGAQVILIEKQPEDTFTVLGNDIGHLNSTWQLNQIGIPEFDPVQFMNEYQIYGAGRVQPTLLNQFAYRSGEAFDWFVDNFSEDEKAEIIPLNWPTPEGYQYNRGFFTSYVGTAQLGGSVGMTDALKRSQAIAQEAGVEFVWGTAAVRLVHNEEGTEVTGVICEKEDGSFVQYDAEAVVLCCGDIGSNSGMYNAICRENYELGEYADCAAMSGRDGSGIAMALRIGAKVEIGTGGDMGSHAFIPMTPMEGVECLWLNKYGKRYCNEAFGGPLLSGCAGARQPGNMGYIVWDANWQEVYLNQLAGHLAPKEWDTETLANVESYMTAAVGSGAEGDDTSGKYLYCADTLEELCDYMGMEEGVKQNTLAAIEKWNTSHAAGVDDEFGRQAETMWPIVTGPFYGYPCTKRVGGGSLVATSGLLVTGEQQVQGQGFEPIKGLFACGNNSGGRFPMGYNGIMNGVSIGMCLTLGYTLGEYLATSEDINQYCALGSQNAEVKQSENAMAGPPPGEGE